MKSYIYSEVKTIIDIDRLSYYTDICEISYDNISLINYAKNKFKKIIITVNNPDIDLITDLYYSYDPYIINIDSDCNLKNISKIKNKIGKIRLSYKSNYEILYHTTASYDIFLMEKDCKYQDFHDFEFERFIKNINFIKKTL